MRVELVADTRCIVGESPVWHPDEACVYWVDIMLGRLFRYDPVCDTYERVYDGLVIGGLTIQDDGALLMFLAQGAIASYHNGGVQIEVGRQPQEIGFRFNDVLADPKGRVFCGIMPYDGPITGYWNRPDAALPMRVIRRFARLRTRALRRCPPTGRLLRVNQSGSSITLLDNLGRPNGMGFTPDRTGLYLTDSVKREIHLFDFDVRTGMLSNRRLFDQMPDGKGTPDGLAVDAEGFVWSALWNGSALIRHTPNGKVDGQIPIPTSKVSSLTFGGKGYSDIYVTTAAGSIRGEKGHGAGALFHVNVGIRGLPDLRSALQFGNHPKAPSTAQPESSQVLRQ